METNQIKISQEMIEDLSLEAKKAFYKKITTVLICLVMIVIVYFDYHNQTYRGYGLYLVLLAILLFARSILLLCIREQQPKKERAYKYAKKQFKKWNNRQISLSPKAKISGQYHKAYMDAKDRVDLYLAYIRVLKSH